MRTGSRLRSLPALLAAAALCLPGARAFGTGIARAAHTTTLLPTGDVLIAGGMSGPANGNRLATAELLQASNGPFYINVGNMSVERASATATVLPNGLVLIAGGINAANTVNASVEIYDPKTRTFGAVVGATARFSHTATLLNNGTVLLCGGMTAAPPANNPTTSCDYYTPTGINVPGGGMCLAGAGSGCVTAATVNMAFGRAFHTATLLKDGKVLFAGGFNPAAVATNGWLTTMEKYDPLTRLFGSAANLFEARAYHTATMMGDGKVLIAGGFNGKNQVENRGILDTEEIYDPIADAMTPAPQLNTRRMMHTSMLSADGSVVYFGGLGNITTTYQSAVAITFGNPFAITVNPVGAVLSNGNMNTGSTPFTFANGASLSQQVVGTIVEGEVLFSSVSLTFPSGNAYFVPGDPTNPATGLQANMAGINVTCKSPGGIGNCGYIDPSSQMTMNNLNQGKAFFTPLLAQALTGTAVGPAAGAILFNGPLNSASPPTALTGGSNFNANLTVPMPLDTLGATLLVGTLHITAGAFTQVSSYTVTLTGTTDINLAGQVVAPDGNGGAELSLPGQNIAGLVGTITWAGDANSGYILGPNAFPAANSCFFGFCSMGVALDGQIPALALTADVSFVPNSVDVSMLSMTVDVSTIVIHSMVFGSPEYYTPNANQATLTLPDGTSPGESFVFEKFGQTATLMPNNDMLFVGGIDCTTPAPVFPNAGCGALVPQNDNNFFFGIAGFPRSDTTYIEKNNNSNSSGALLKGRALHTATLLPNGKILVAGGTDGSNVLASGEIFDPATLTSVATAGTMRDDRDLHTATLLPNGRVLIAGGFTTNSITTDSTNGAEIYYPDTSRFIPTGTMITPRRGHTAVLLPDGTVMVTGGLTTGGIVTPTSEIFRSTTQVWSAAAALPGGQERTGHTATLLKDGTVLVVGGTNAGGPMATVYRFNPSNPGLGWVLKAALPHALYQHTATLLFDGRVLVAGGNDGFGEFNASYIYDPQANTWTPTTGLAPLLQPRYGHTATLLPNDTVMITGGNTRFGIVPTEIEVFHVNASSWVAGGIFFADGARTFHTMTLAPDGNVYALGGSNGVIGGPGTSILSVVDRSYFTTNPDQYTKNAPPSFRQSSITTATPPIILAGPANNFTVTGVQFRGATEASGGGSASANSSFSFPHLILQGIDGSGGGSTQGNSGFVVDLTTQVYLLNTDGITNNYQTLDSSLTVVLPTLAAQLPIGWYNARVGANDLYSNGVFVQAGPQKPSAAPSVASGTTNGISSFTWTWSAVPAIGVPGVPGVVDGYNVYESSGGVFLGSAPAAAFPTYVQTGLAPNSTEQIVVAAFNISGDGPLQYSATSYTLSTSPINVSIASVTFSTLFLQWTDNGNTPGTIYEVSESTDILVPFSTSISTPVPAILGLTTTFVTITGLVSNSTFSFRLRSFNTAGVPSSFSAIVTTITRNSVAGVGCGPTFSGNTTTSIGWGWGDAGAVIKYNIYNSSNGFLLGTAASGNPNFPDVSLGTNTQRSIEVTAVTSAGEGPLSASATCWTLAAVPAQGFPLMTSTEATSVSINWIPNGNPNGTVYQSNFDTYIGSAVVVTTITTTGFQAYLPGLTPSNYYSATVLALNGANFPSAVLQAGTTFTLPAQPQPLTIQGTTPVSISASWNTNGNSTMTYYQLTYSLNNFATAWSTAVFFASQNDASTATISGLLTSTQYWLRVQAENPFGEVDLNGFSTSVATITFNGGAPPGSLAGTLTALGTSEISGNLGGPSARFVDLRSPGGAFTTDTGISVSTYSINPLDHGALCPGGVPGAVDPILGGNDGVVLSIVDSPALQPTHPIALSMSYTNAEALAFGAPVSQLALARFDPASGTCVPLQTTFNTATQTFYAQLNHFSLYQLVAVALATDVGTARIYPNPYRAATDGYITIDQIPPGSRVRIFTLRGERILDAVANGIGNVTWMADNSAGRPVASGEYIVVLESNGSKKILKLAVIR